AWALESASVQVPAMDSATCRRHRRRRLSKDTLRTSRPPPEPRVPLPPERSRDIETKKRIVFRTAPRDLTDRRSHAVRDVELKHGRPTSFSTPAVQWLCQDHSLLRRGEGRGG